MALFNMKIMIQAIQKDSYVRKANENTHNIQ